MEDQMTCNVGGADRMVRFVLGTAFVLAALLVPMAPIWTIALYVLAAIAWGTALLRFCPLNRLLGIDSCRPAAEPRG
jgi:hypothetical protein